MDWCWSWNSNTLAIWCKELTHWKRPWCWERLKAGGEGDDREWDGWMTSPTPWTWVWASFRSWWWTGKPSVLQSMGLQRVGHDWVTELNWTNSMGDKCNCPMVSTFCSTTLLGNQSIHKDWPSWIIALSWWMGLCNSMKLWAMPHRVTQDNGSEHRVLTKRDPLEEGMANHPNILSVRISWTV